MNTLIIDIGTSSMRGILFGENGKRIAFSQVKYQILYCGNGIVEQEPKELEDVLCEIIRNISKQTEKMSETIDVIALTAQRSSITAVDQEGKPLIPFIMWQDVRNQKEVDGLKKYDEEIYLLSGAYPNTVFSGSKIVWLKNNQNTVYANAHKILNIPEYLLFLITGKYKTDYTYGSRTNLMNIRKCKWDSRLLEIFQIEENKLCELVSPGSVIGHTTQSFAEKANIKRGIPVISAGGDQQCAAVGQGAYKEGKISIVTGTGAFLIGTCSSVPENLNYVTCNASAVKGKYILEASVLSCCSAFDWFISNFYGKDYSYEEIGKQLEKRYDISSDCIVLPYFQGRSTPDWNTEAKASFHNITLATGREELLQGILNGIFMEVKNNIDNFQSYVTVREGYISGGLTQNNTINQMQADMYGIPLYKTDEVESTAIGALMITLVSQSVYKDVNHAFESICKNSITEKIEPDLLHYKKNLALQKRMKELYECENQ